MNEIYVVFWDHDSYNEDEYVLIGSGIEGFWTYKPTDEEVEAFLKKKNPGWIMKGNDGKELSLKDIGVVWDIETMSEI